MEAVLKLGFSDEKGIRCCACMLSFSKGEHYHCAAIGQRPICPEEVSEEGGERRKRKKIRKATVVDVYEDFILLRIKTKAGNGFCESFAWKEFEAMRK